MLTAKAATLIPVTNFMLFAPPMRRQLCAGRFVTFIPLVRERCAVSGRSRLPQGNASIPGPRLHA